LGFPLFAAGDLVGLNIFQKQLMGMILLPSFASLAALNTVAVLSHAMKRLDYGHRMIDHRQILRIFSLVFFLFLCAGIDFENQATG